MQDGVTYINKLYTIFIKSIQRMKNKILTTVCLLSGLTTFGQINMKDSTAQVITYWEKGDKQNYLVTAEKIKIKGTDTASREKTTYNVQITVLSKSEKSYTIEWLYKDIKTTSILRKDFQVIPEMDNVLKQIEGIYSTKEAIESVSIKDIQQFHTFHGAKYKLGEVLEEKLKVPNIIGTEPFDSDLTIYLDEINEKDNNFIIRATQIVNKEQLTNAMFNYFTTMAKNMKVDPPKREDLKALGNETLTASRIHGTGWVVYSVQTTTITSDNVTNIEERIIEIQ